MTCANAQATDLAQMAAFGFIALCTVHIESCTVARLQKAQISTLRHTARHSSSVPKCKYLCLRLKPSYCKVLEMPISQDALMICIALLLCKCRSNCDCMNTTCAEASGQHGAILTSCSINDLGSN